MENCCNYMLLVITFFCYCNSVRENKVRKKGRLRATLIQAIPLYVYALLHNMVYINDQCHLMAESFFFLDVLTEAALKLIAC